MAGIVFSCAAGIAALPKTFSEKNKKVCNEMSSSPSNR